MELLLWDDPVLRQRLCPFTYLRPIGTFRLGVRTLAEKWIGVLGSKSQISYLSAPYLCQKYVPIVGRDTLLVNAAVLPSREMKKALLKLSLGEALYVKADANTHTYTDYLLAARMSGESTKAFITAYHRAYEVSQDAFTPLSGAWIKKTEVYASPVETLVYPWQLYQWNARSITHDLGALSCVDATRLSALKKETRLYGDPRRLYIGSSARLRGATLNTEEGGIFVGEGAVVEEGALLRGPCAVGRGARIMAGARIKGGATIGPESKAGGEIHTSLIMGYSNKAHEGFMGHSVIGHWCNIGAGTEISNLKNTYGDVKMWQYDLNNNKPGKYISTEAPFGGTLMGDHSKCGIHTTFNTGTVVGVCAQVIGHGYTPKHIPSFAWGFSEKQSAKWTTYAIEKAIQVAQRVYERRKMCFGNEDEAIMRHVFNETTPHRA